MNIYWMLLREKSKDLWLLCRPFRIPGTQSGLLRGSPASPAVYWPGEFQLAWFRKLPRSERSKISSLRQITSGRHSLKPASLSPVLVADDRTPAGLAWTWPPTSSHCRMQPMPWPPEVLFSLTCKRPWHFETWFGDTSPIVSGWSFLTLCLYIDHVFSLGWLFVDGGLWHSHPLEAHSLVEAKL